MIEVRLFSYLPDLCRSKQRRVCIPYREGLTVLHVIELEGIGTEDVAIMVNGMHASGDTCLSDGDSVFFLPPIAGG